MKRREFVKACAALMAAGCPVALADQNAVPRLYSRVRLIHEDGQAVKTHRLSVNKNYIFHYPFAGTPCFLLNLGKPALQNVPLKTADGLPYLWQGGAGAGRSIVAYSAICAHRMAYPTRQITFISFRDKASAGSAARRHMIHCCAEHSEYDPARGAKVVSGPAEQPLAAILLEYEQDTDEVFAVGTLGGEMFNAFFRKYDFKLSLEYGASRGRGDVSGGAVVSELSNFCKQQVSC